MTIALPGTSKFGLSALLGRKSTAASKLNAKTTTSRALKPQEVAKLFAQDRQAAPKVTKPAKLNDNEKQDRARLSSLRGALYAKD